MHISDALLSARVGGGMLGISALAVGYASRRVAAADAETVPRMGILAAFVFAAQMVNVAIPGTGASGHLVGGMLLAILLGPDAALLAVTSVLLIQAFLFGDGGLLALGANIFNMGVLPCYGIFPLVAFFAGRGHASGRKEFREEEREFRKETGGLLYPGRSLTTVAVFFGAFLSIVLGAALVVAEILLSGKTLLPSGKFFFLMLLVHIPIGLFEGGITVLILRFLGRESIVPALKLVEGSCGGRRTVWTFFGTAALVTALVVSAFASQAPDGLNWSLEYFRNGIGYRDATTEGNGRAVPAPFENYRISGIEWEESAERALAGGAGVVITLIGSAVWGGGVIWLSARRNRRKRRDGRG